jgi:hypothetical protein
LPFLKAKGGAAAPAFLRFDLAAVADAYARQVKHRQRNSGQFESRWKQQKHSGTAESASKEFS